MLDPKTTTIQDLIQLVNRASEKDRKTAHNAVATGFYVEVFPYAHAEGGENICGNIVIEGARTDLGDGPMSNVIANIFTDETTNKIGFDSAEELLEMLENMQ